VAEEYMINNILNIINVFLGIMLALLSLSYMKFYSSLNDWWRRLLLLAYIFILEETVIFIGFEFFAIVMKTIFIGYFLYFLSYITVVVTRIDAVQAESEMLKERLAKMKAIEEE
jgi:DMSO/TMAO reductase YedYZ heme-binding membrane subunit